MDDYRVVALNAAVLFHCRLNKTTTGYGAGSGVGAYSATDEDSVLQTASKFLDWLNK